MEQNIGYSDKYAAYSFLKLVVGNSDFVKGLTEAHKKLADFSQKCFRIGQNMQTIGERLAAPFQETAKVFADFDDQMRRVLPALAPQGAGIPLSGPASR